MPVISPDNRATMIRRFVFFNSHFTQPLSANNICSLIAVAPASEARRLGERAFAIRLPLLELPGPLFDHCIPFSMHNVF